MEEETNNILDIDEKPINITGIIKEDLITVNPESGCDLNNDGEIRYKIQPGSQYLLPSKSYLYMECNIRKSDGTKLKKDDEITLVNNAPMFLFSRITYAINGIPIEDINDPGIASLMKGILSYSSNLSKQNRFGWILDSTSSLEYKIIKYIELRDGKITFCIPLSHIFGFAECFNKITYGEHSLKLWKTNNKNIFHTNNTEIVTPAKLTVTKLSWLIPKIFPSLGSDNKLANMYLKDKTYYLSYYNRHLHFENAGTSNTFMTDITTNEKTRYLIIGFQTNRINNYNNTAVFDHCNLETIYAQIDGVNYPYDHSLRSNFNEFNSGMQYTNAQQFKNSYYQTTKDCLFIDEDHYCIHYPLFVIDVTKQDDRIRKINTNVRIMATFSTNIPANTKCYCLILSERLIETNGQSVIVKY